MRPDCAVLLQRHTELATNPLYIFGESYAGHYVPHIATYARHGQMAVLAAPWLLMTKRALQTASEALRPP